MTAATFRSRGNGVRTDFQRPGGRNPAGTLAVAVNGSAVTSGFTQTVDGTGLPIVRFNTAPAAGAIVSVTLTRGDIFDVVPAGVSATAFAALEARVDTAETEITALDGRVTALEPTP